MKGMDNVKKLVEVVLMQNPATRDDDRLLYLEVCKRVNPITSSLSFEDVFMNGASYGLPVTETVRRARQRVQQEHSELRASREIEAIREERRIEVKAWALNTKTKSI